MEKGFDHLTWPTPRLQRRLTDVLRHLRAMPHSPERRQQITLEAECLDFEIRERAKDEGTIPLTLDDIVAMLDEEDDGEAA